MATINSWGSNIPVEETKGGTNQSTFTTGDLLYSDASNSLEKLAIGTTDQILTVTGGVPVWAANTGGTGSDEWTLISTHTPSTVISYEVTSGMGTAYDNYTIMFNSLAMSGTDRIDVSFSDNGGVSYNTVYLKGLNYYSGGVGSTSSYQFQLSSYIAGTYTGPIVWSMNKAATFKPIKVSVGTSSSKDFYDGFLDTTSDIDAFKLIVQGGATFSGGSFTLWGK